MSWLSSLHFKDRASCSRLGREAMALKVGVVIRVGRSRRRLYAERPDG